MVLNYPGPYELRLHYTTATVEHVMAHSVALDAPVNLAETFDNITGGSFDGTTVALDDYVEAWLLVLAPFFHGAGASFNQVELWSYPPQSFDASFISSYVPVQQPASGNGTTFASQMTFTFRTREGGIFKQVLLENTDASADVDAYATASAAEQDLFDFFVNETISLAVGRDTSRPFMPIKVSKGQNERLFRKRFR